MKILRYVVMAILTLAISGVAHAFVITAQDPASTDLPFFLIQPGMPFSFQFADFPGGSYTFDGVTYTGWAVGFNDSDQTITNFTLGFGNFLDSEKPECNSDAFDNVSCGITPDGSNYYFDFIDGCGTNSCGIGPDQFVVILENAVPGSDFVPVEGVANVPEPASIWLALSGLGSAGYFVRRRRKLFSL